jgi:Na+/H+-dicarboxylate symporter
MKTYKISNDPSQIEGAIDYLRKELSSGKIPNKEVIRCLLASEEILSKMTEHSTDNITVTVSAFLDAVEIHFAAKGTPFDVAELEDKLLFEQTDSDDDEANDAIRNMVSRIYADSLNIRYEHGTNKVTFYLKKSQFAQLINVMCALPAGLCVGYLMHRFLPSDVSASFSDNIFGSICTLFINALKMIVSPLVFCSIASSIADFSDLKALGKLAVKVVAFYIMTSIIAIGIGLVMYRLFPIGNPELAATVGNAALDSVGKNVAAPVSVWKTIVGIIPNNIITPFNNANMLQIIFLAIVLGLATSTLSKKYPQIRTTLIILNDICTKITTVLVSLIPIVVFCSMAKMMVSIDLSALLNVASWIPLNYAGCFVMLGVYILLLLVVGRLNPLKFLHKFYPAMVTAFSLASSNASLPTSIKQSEEMGISKRIYSFSLPLGATINMNGSCIMLMITSLFMAKIFNITVTGTMLTSLFVSILVLSLGAPGVPGAALVCCTLLVPQIGVPTEAVSLIMGLYPIVSMIMVCMNVTGDAVATAIVARHENLLDLQKFNK